MSIYYIIILATHCTIISILSSFLLLVVQCMGIITSIPIILITIVVVFKFYFFIYY